MEIIVKLFCKEVSNFLLDLDRIRGGNTFIKNCGEGTDGRRVEGVVDQFPEQPSGRVFVPPSFCSQTSVPELLHVLFLSFMCIAQVVVLKGLFMGWKRT